MTESRLCAYRALKAVFQNGVFSPRALDEVVSSSDLTPQDVSLVSNIVYGTLEKERFLDECIDSRLKSSKRIHKDIRVILRMSLYQMLFCDKIPKYSAINEGVELAKTVDKSLAGFVNGVLRSIDREGIEGIIPDKDNDYKAYISTVYSVSDYIAEILIKQYGKSAESILAAAEGRPALTAKINTCKTDAEELIGILSEEGITAERHSFFDDVLLLSNTGSVDSSDAFKRGLFHIQDLASVICCRILNAQQGDTVYDICSAPGGKSFSIAENMKNQGSIISCDVSEKKLRLVKEGAERLGLVIIKTLCRNGTSGDVLPMADKVLCDVPCSGFGVIRKKPEIRNKTFDDVKSLPEIQYSILEHSALSVKKGGVLVYSTCTLNTDENEAVTDRFLREHNNFSPSYFTCEYADITDWRITLRPDINGTDGFFVARMVRND